jgi:uncharacterized cupin superfamily protein
MSDQPKPHPILNVEAVEFIDLRERARKRGQNPPPAGFDARLGPLGERIGARKLGYNLTVIAPGKAAFPKHSHRVNEEMFFILEGHGELRLGDAVYPVRPGDVIACPAGDAGGAHQLRNTGGVPASATTISWPSRAAAGTSIIGMAKREPQRRFVRPSAQQEKATSCALE